MNLRTDVRGHDDNCILEIDRASLAVGDPSIVEHLQEDIENVVVRFSISSKRITL